MTTIVTRAGKGSPLTHTEVDTNFTNLNTAKLEAGAIALGSAGTPSISFVSDTNTGIFSPGADQVAISTNGAGRLFVDASGNIGVGVTPVDVAGFNSIQIGDTNGSFFDCFVGATHEARILSLPGDLRINQITSGSLGLYTNNTERLRITSAGLVGIGTSTPQATLHTNGAILSSNALVALSASNIFFDQPTSVVSRIGVVGANTSTVGTLSISQYSSNGSVGRDVVHINNSGNVGIGTTSPSYVLDVSGGAGNGIRYQNTANSIGVQLGASSASVQIGSTTSHPVEFLVGSVERARIDSSGRLLVGTSSAGAGAVDAASIVGSTLNQSTGLRTLSSGGTLDLNLLGAGIVGHLYVTSTETSNAGNRTSTIFFIATRQGNNTAITSLNSANGSTSGRSFTITNPSTNIFRFTDTSSSACSVSMSFVGGIGF